MSFGFLVINVCNDGEHYETPCITGLVDLLMDALMGGWMDIVWKRPRFDTDHRPVLKTKTGTKFSGTKQVNRRSQFENSLFNVHGTVHC
jgi:hypothetical protein